MTTGARALVTLLAVTAAACHSGSVRSTWTGATAAVTVAATLSDAALASAVGRVTLKVSPGTGPDFEPIDADLARAASGAGWSTFLSGVPAGPGRRFEIWAMDAGGAVLASGGATADVVAGRVVTLTITLSGQGGTVENQAPVIDYLSISATEVEAGAEVTVGVSAHDPDPADAVSYRWSATCGAFADAGVTATTWVAPPAAGTCRLTATVSDGRAAVSSTEEVTVRGGRAVGGSRLVTHWPDPPAGPSAAPAPDTATSLPPQVLVRQPGGGWTVLPGGHRAAGGAFVEGRFGADGRFEVPGVPAGRYTLCHRPPGAAVTCLDTAADEVDLGYDVLGRADQAPPAASTPVTFALEGLDPWNPMLERLELTSSGAGLFDVMASGPDLRGGQVADRLVEDWAAGAGGGTPLNLLASADLLHLHQLSARSFYTAGVLHLYAAATHAATLGGLPPMASGQAQELAVRLAPLPLEGSLAIDWDTAAFEAAGARLGPAARLAPAAQPHRLTVGAGAHRLELPAPAAAGAPSLVSLALPAGAGRVAGTAWYGRFLPVHWKEWRSVRYQVEASYQLPGTPLPWVEAAGLQAQVALPAAAGALGPALSPVQAPTIGAADAFLDQAGVGESPTIAWAAPALGEPAGYLVEICQLEARGDRTGRTVVLRHLTEDRQVTVPPGILVSGQSYFARITAEGAGFPGATPLRAAHVATRATVLTGLFTR